MGVKMMQYNKVNTNKQTIDFLSRRKKMRLFNTLNLCVLNIMSLFVLSRTNKAFF
jgi:hypothetical protein